MLMQSNTRLAEDLKNEKKHVMIVKEKAHRKLKAAQISMQAEHRKWKLREKEIFQKLQKKVAEKNKDEFLIRELQKKFSALKAEYNMRINSNSSQFGQQNKPSQQQIIQSLDANNKSLTIQCDKQRRELSALKQTILNCNSTMQQQQKQILVLNGQLSELRKLNGLGGNNSSSEQLLTKQIRLLKSQRRMLIQEIKDVREQNDKLKTKIVTSEQAK